MVSKILTMAYTKKVATLKTPVAKKATATTSKKVVKKTTSSTPFIKQLESLGHMTTQDILELVHGKEGVILNQTGSHNWGATGETFIFDVYKRGAVVNGAWPNISFTNAKTESPFNNTLNSANFSLCLSISQKDIEEEIENLNVRLKKRIAEETAMTNKRIAEAKQKLKIMGELGMDEYDHNIVQTYEKVKDMKNLTQKDRIELAKKLAK